MPPDLDDAVSKSKQVVERRSVALFGGDPANQVQVGTGVLLDIAGTGFVVTAAHVMDHPDVKRGILGVGQATGAVPPLWLTGAGFWRTVPTGNNSMVEDLRDLAVVALAHEQRRELERGLDFTSLGEVLPAYLPASDDLLLVHGFPDEKSRTATEGPIRVTRYEDACCATQPRFDANAQEARAGNARRVVVRYKRRVWFSRQPLPGGRAPDPHGMSGGGMWLCAKIGLAKFWSREAIRLVAIVTDYPWKLGCLVGTPAIDAVTMIYATAPATRGAIEAAFPGFDVTVTGAGPVGGAGEDPRAG